MLLNEFLKEHRLVQEQGATISRQQRQIEALTAGLQKMSAEFELTKLEHHSASRKHKRTFGLVDELAGGQPC